LFFTPEELANDDMHEIINWMLQNGGVPPREDSTDSVERKLGEKLRDFRTARNNPENKAKHKCYNVEQIAIDRGFPHLLYSLEEQRNVRIREFAHFVKEYNRTPKLSSEKDLYKWWYNTKTGIKKKSAKQWTAANKKLAEELGVAHYFKVV
jgi:hypothetical protein